MVHWLAVPVEAEYDPTGQDVQVAAPALEKEPAAHEEQGDLPSEY
jgi:hypothetical protein